MLGPITERPSGPLNPGVCPMNPRGYSLIEMLVAIAMVSVLMCLAVAPFANFLRRLRSEAQTRSIYAEIQKARANALFQRRETRLKFYPTRFEIYSSAADFAGASPIAIQLLTFPIEINGTGVNLGFDARGMALNNRSICIADPQGTGAVDSIVISETRINLGKLGKDGKWKCDAENISFR
jgi:prepilin-type N-terminal cleavage/methylation domain-containing protein